MERICSNLNNFFNVALATKGSRTTADNNAIDVALCAVMDSDVFIDGLGHEYARLLDVRWKALDRGREHRVRLDVAKGWINVCKKAYRNQLGLASTAIISEFLHSPEASRIDNERKEEISVLVKVDGTDVVSYLKHFRRQYVGPWPEVMRRFKLSDAFK